MSVISGCTTTAQQAQIDAGARIGAAAVGIRIDDEPAECGAPWSVLPVPPGEDKAVTVRRYDAFILGPVNDQKKRCSAFNKSQRVGLQGK